MSAATNIGPVAASAHYAEPPRQKELLRSYDEIANYILKKFTSYLAIAIMDLTFLRYTQPASKTSMQYADELYVKSYKVENVYNVFTLNDFFIEEVSFSNFHSLKKHWAVSSHVNLINI